MPSPVKEDQAGEATEAHNDEVTEDEVKERRKKSPLYTSVGSRKNLLELAGNSLYQTTILDYLLNLTEL